MNTTRVVKLITFIFPLIFLSFSTFFIFSFESGSKNFINSQIETKSHSIKLHYQLTKSNATKITDYVKNLKGIYNCQPNFTKNTIDIQMDSRFRGSEIDAIVEKFEHDLYEKH